MMHVDPEDLDERVRSVKITAGPVIALAMGERGVASRILAPKFGSYLTFGALSSEKASAPGQPLLSELKHLYGLPQQSAATKVTRCRSASESGSVLSRAYHTQRMCALHQCSYLIGHNWMDARSPSLSCELML